MPLDTSTYGLALLRLDGRRWNELRRIDGQISTQAAADGSSYFEMGNTKIVCTVVGPEDARRNNASGSSGSEALIQVEINTAAFSAVDRKRRGGAAGAGAGLGADKRTTEMQLLISQAFSTAVFTHLYPNSTVTVRLHVLAQDGALLAACVNATTLALIDAGIPMADYVVACTAGSTASYGSSNEIADPLLDLNGLEEQDLPHLTVGALGATRQVVALSMETRVQQARIQDMLALGLDGCSQVRTVLDNLVRTHGKSILDKTVSG